LLHPSTLLATEHIAIFSAMAPPILKSKKRTRPEQGNGDKDRHVRFGEGTLTSSSVLNPKGDKKGNGQSILRSNKHQGGGGGGHDEDHSNSSNHDDDEDDVSQFGVEISYDEGGAVSKTAVEQARKRRRHGDDVDIDDEDDEEMNRERTKAPAGKATTGTTPFLNKKGNQRQGEEAVDSTYSLLTDQSATTTADCPIEAFNLEEERTSGEGYFDGDTYVFREKGGAAGEEDDAWLDSLDTTTDAGSAAAAAEARSKMRLHTNSIESDDEDNDDENDNASSANEEEPSIQDKVSLIHELISLLATPSETVSAAMRRFGKLMGRNSAKTKLPKSQSQQKQNGSSGNHKHNKASPSPPNKTTQIASDNLQRLTALTNALLLQHNEHDIYQKTRQDLVFVVGVLDDSNKGTSLHLHGEGTNSAAPSLNGASDGSSGTNTNNAISYFSESKQDTQEAIGSSEGPTSMPPPPPKTSKQAQATAVEVLWEYIGQADQQTHGPYTTEQMIQWTSAGYFVGASAVKIRSIGRSTNSSDANAAATAATVNDLMADLEDSDDDGDDDKDDEVATAGTTTTQKEESPAPWMQSDQVDFKSY
jgi:hypothetical protein